MTEPPHQPTSKSGEKPEEKDFGEIPEEGEFVVHGTVYCKPEHADACAALYSKMTKTTKTEPGVIYYSLARNSEDPTIFYFFEHYENKKAFETHVAGEDTQVIFKEGYFRDVEARIERPIV